MLNCTKGVLNFDSFVPNFKLQPRKAFRSWFAAFFCSGYDLKVLMTSRMTCRHIGQNPPPRPFHCCKAHS